MGSKSQGTEPCICSVLAELLALPSILGFFQQLQIKFYFNSHLLQRASVTEFLHKEDIALQFSFYMFSLSFLPRWSVSQSKAVDPGACHKPYLFTRAFCQRGWSGREAGVDAFLVN